MRHQLRLVGWALLLGVSLPSLAWGASQAWLPKNTLTLNGNTATWTATSAGEDSLALTCIGECTCDNTHATTNITVYRATIAGVKLTGDYWKAPAAVNCSDTTLPQCSTVVLGPGIYIFDPDSAAVATAQCRAKNESP